MWLNSGNSVVSDNRLYLSVSADFFLARGYKGQNFTVILSQNLVLLHLGACIPPSGPGAWTPEGFIGNVLKAILK